jgi:hypothetical protein
MTTATFGHRSHVANDSVATLSIACARLTVLLACLAVSLGMWWAFAQVVLHVVS